MDDKRKIARRNVSLIFLIFGLALTFIIFLLTNQEQADILRFVAGNIIYYLFVALLWFGIPFLAITIYEKMK